MKNAARKGKGTKISTPIAYATSAFRLRSGVLVAIEHATT